MKLEAFWFAFVPLYNQYGTKTPANHIHKRDLEKVDTLTDSIDNKQNIVPHRAMRTKGTEYQWKWKEIFSVFKVPKYRVALNIEHWG